jgi:PAS domain S-box-containing protein
MVTKIKQPGPTQPPLEAPTGGATTVDELHVNYQAFLEQSPDAMLLLDAEHGLVLNANGPAEKLFGTPLSSMLNRPLTDLCLPSQPGGIESRALLREHMQRAAGGDMRLREMHFRGNLGRLIECEMRIVPLPFPQQDLLHVRIADVTRRNLDDALRTGQGRLLEMVARGAPLRETLDSLMLLIESQSKGVYCSVLLLDDDGVTIHPGSGPSLPSEYMAALDGFSIGPGAGSCGTAMFRKEAVIVTDIMNDPLWAPYKGLVEPHGFRACWSTPIYLTQDVVLGSFAMYYKDVRSPIAEDMRLIGAATHLAGIAIERTRRERELALHRGHLEELVAARTNELTKSNKELAKALDELGLMQGELVRRDKLAALGALVAGMAHELNTPIGNSLVTATTMADHTGRLAESINTGLKRSTLDSYLNEAREAGDILVRNLQRAADLLLSFKEVAVDQASSQRHHFSLSTLLQEVLPALTVAARPRGISIDCRCEGVLEMNSYPGSLTQVLQNLINNCLIHGFANRTAGTITLHAQSRPGNLIALAISDDGTGIADNNLDRVFDPFFTTKMGSGGSGLGLHVVHNIVTGILGGKIELRSALGYGTTFTLLLPAMAPQYLAQAVTI